MIFEYRALERKHVKKIQEWVNADPNNLQNLHNHIGTKRSPAQYVAEYSDRFAIAGYLAQDIHMPGADKMLREYNKYSKLEGEVFG